MSVINVLLCLLCTCSPWVRTGISDDSRLDEILNKLEKRYDTFEALFCRYRQVERISHLTEDVRLEGDLYFRKPHFVMMEMRGDENLDIYVNGEKIWIDDRDLDEVEIFDFSRMSSDRRLIRVLPPFFLRTVAELKVHFRISLESSGNGKHRLALLPKSPEDLHLQSIRFDVDGRGRISWMKVVYDPDNIKEINFRDWKKIPKTSKYFFQYRKK